MRYYVVLDTNVLVSALLGRNSNPAKLMDEAANGCVIPVYSSEILEEYEEVLHRERFPFAARNIRALLDLIKTRGICIEPGKVKVTMPDPDDVVFYAVVMEKRKEEDAYLVTGNQKHFPREPFIVTPKEMLAIIATGVAGEACSPP